MRGPRLGLLAAIGIAGLVLVLPVSATVRATQNPFAGLWDTTLSGGVTGTVTFRVISATDGVSEIAAIGGKACAQPTVYYRGDYTDTAPDSGAMVACTSGSAQLIGRYRNNNTALTYPGGGFVITLDASQKNFSGYFTADDPSYAGQQFPYSGMFVTHVDGDGCCPVPTGPPGPTTAPTATTPFGTPVTIPYQLNGIVQAPSPTLPAATTEVDLSAEISDADVTRMAAALKVALAAYNRRRELEAVTYFCIIYSNSLGGAQAPLEEFGKVVKKCDETISDYLKRKPSKRTLASAASHCGVTVVPVWKPGTRPTATQTAEAVAAARNEVHASCTAASGHLTLKAVAGAKTTLNQVLGKSAQAEVEATGKAPGGPQLTLTYAPPRSRGAPPPPTSGKAKPGHYAGHSSDNNDAVSFDVTADRANVTNLRAEGGVTCSDSSTWTWTVSSSGNNPISSALAFSHSYSGALTISSSTISNVNATYAFAGTLTAGGGASGTFRISRISWDQSGKHYDCTGAQSTWTAHVGG